MKRPFPRLLNRIGMPIVLCSWLLPAELIWEQTALSWAHGPQMVGFSIAHTGVGILLALPILAGMAWVLATLIAALLTRSLGGRALLLLVAFAAALGALTIPYGFWQRLFISQIPPVNACQFSSYAAADGDLRTVKAFVKHGTSVNCMSDNGTPLHAAALRGQTEVIEYLIANGADVNALNPYGDSVLASAMDADSPSAEVQALLGRYGATLVRGTREQRDRVISEQVQRDIDELNKHMPGKTH